MRPPFLRRSRNEDARLGWLPLLVTLSGLALWLAVVVIGIVALVAQLAPAYVGPILLALIVALAVLMVHKGMS